MAEHREHVIRGLKASLHNPRVSDKAKAHAEKELKEMGESVGAAPDSELRHEENVIRGYKAAIHNPRVSDEAKAHAAKQLKELNKDVDDPGADS